ncbi:MAG: hypothetical protein KKD05_05125 [Candidatus Omnitrophica bacterium]|nr:hypothetical protein [Candidatus Omnitrophota bacterium]
MSFVPDHFKKNVRIKVKIIRGKICPVIDEEIPIIKDGTIADLIIPVFAFKNEEEAFALAKEEKKKILDKGTVLMCVVYPNQDAGKKELNIVLEDDLYLYTKKDDTLAKCCPCQCTFTDKNNQKIKASSLNSAYSKISEIYEPKRNSHTGNIFDKVFYVRENGKYGKLKELRGDIE